MRAETKRMAITALVSVLATGAMSSADTVMYVDATAGAGGSGETWEGAYRFLADAITAAADTGGAIDLHVAGGTYVPDRNESFPEGSGDRFASFQLVSGVRIIGGYAGLAGGEDGDTRDPDLYPTILSGDLAGDDVPGFINNAENSYHVVLATGADATAVLDGVTITAGHANGDLDAACFGGSMHGAPCEISGQCPGGLCVSPDSTGAGLLAVSGGGTLLDCRIVDNFAQFQGAGMMLKSGSNLIVTDSYFGGNRALDNGGALYLGQSSPIFTRCEFDGNSGGRYAGAACNRDQSNALFIDCLFTRNTAAEATDTGGGAIVNASSSPRFTRCTFVENRSIAGKGGAIYNKLGFHPELGPSFAEVRDCTFEANEALLNGGAIYDDEGSMTTVVSSDFLLNTAGRGGAVYNTANSATTLASSSLDNNSVAEMGGAVYSEGDLVVLETSLRFNTAGQRGGAIYNAAGSIEVFNSFVEYNQALDAEGGGIYAIGDLTVEDVRFRENQADSYGGGVYSPGSSTSSIFVTRCTFSGNTARYGGGAYGSGIIIDSVFDENFASRYGGGFYGQNGFGTIDVSGCAFDGNVAEQGGGMYAGPSFGEPVSIVATTYRNNEATERNGGGLQVTNSPVTIIDCVFEGNASGARGGGLSIDGSIATITGCTVVGNSAVTNGGGIRIADGAATDIRQTVVDANTSETGGGFYVNDAAFLMDATRIIGNMASAWGGGMYAAFSDFRMTNVAVGGNFAVGRGGAFHLFRSNPTITNCSIVQNIAGESGGGIFNQNASSPVISSTILWANQDSTGTVETAQILDYIDSRTVFSHSCVHGWTGDYGGDGNIGDDPMMIDPLGGDGTSGTLDDDLRLAEGSPAIDTGDNTAVPEGIVFDLDGNRRIVDGPDPADRTAPRVDMGAYEVQRPVDCRADVDGDGNIGFGDVLRVLAEWGGTGGVEDVDRNGEVGFGDVLAILAQWGPCE